MTFMMILRTIRGFLAANWKWVLIALVSLFVYIKGTSSWKGYKEAAVKKATELRNLALGAQAAEMERSLAVAALEQSEASREQLKQLLAASQLERKKIAAEAQARIDKIAAIHDASENLENASTERSEEVAKLATDAMNELFQEIEDEINY
jgi:hypothetical protein